MHQQCFEVILNTPMGKRRGTMELFIEDGQISGTLSLFQNREPVSGEIDDQGNCTLHGRFTTLMNQFYYEAAGKIQEDRLELTLCGGKSIYQMSGRSISPQGAEDHDEALRPVGKGEGQH